MMAGQDTALIPRLAWPTGSQAVSASGYWQLKQRDGMKEEGWFLERSSESPWRQRRKANPCKWSAKEMRLGNWKQRMKIAYQIIFFSLMNLVFDIKLRVLHNIRSQRFFSYPFF